MSQSEFTAPRVQLVVSSSASFRGGSDGALYDFLRLHSRTNKRVIVRFLEPGNAVSDSRWSDLSCETIDVGRVRQIHRWVGGVKKLRTLIRSREPEVALGWTAKEHLYLGPACLGTDTKASWFQMGLPNSSCSDRLVRSIPTAAVIACSEFVANLQRQAMPKVPILAVPLGADLSRFDQNLLPSMSDARRQLGLPSDRPIVGIVGRLQRWKGFDTVVDAMPNVLAKHADAYCVMVGGSHSGEPEYEATLRERVAVSTCPTSFRLVGEQQDIPLWMQAMDVVIHASEREPFGIVVVEAMALGKAVIAAVPGGPEEIIRDGTDGLLTISGDALMLADRINQLLRDRTLRERLGMEACKRVSTQFSSEAFSQRLSNALNRIAS